MNRTLCLVAAGLTWSTGLAIAQCPEGTPPPCRTQLAGASARRDPPIDEHRWLVLPFDNLARTPELDIVRDASVQLLYLEMSHWTDVRVVDDARRGYRMVVGLWEGGEAPVQPTVARARAALAQLGN